MTAKPTTEGQNVDRVELSEESFERIQQIVETSVDASMKKTMTEENVQKLAMAFWRAGLDAAQEAATERTKKIARWGLKAIVTRIGTFLLLGTAFYIYGGWAGVIRAFNWTFGTKIPE